MEKIIMDKNKYYNQAVDCAKAYVLPAQRELYEIAGKDFDVIYGSMMNNDMYFGSIIEPGHVYELGYHRCSCPKVLDGTCTSPEHCECTRQSILFIFNELAPDRKCEVEILSTILRGGDKCRFKIVLE